MTSVFVVNCLIDVFGINSAILTQRPDRPSIARPVSANVL